MNTSDYKTSGLLEAYLLGLIPDAEKRQVEQMMVMNPELEEYVSELEVQIQGQFSQGVVPPPPNLRELVELRTDQREVKPYEQSQKQRATESTGDKMNYVDVQVSNTHIQVHKYWRTAFIAVFILSKIFLVAGLYFYFKAQTQAGEIDRLTKQLQQQTAPARTGSMPNQ